MQGAVHPIARLLLEWQSTGDERKLEELLDAIVPLAEPVARQVLLSAGIADPGAIDDAMSKVLGHLWRLPGPRAGDRGVAVFRPRGRGDAGIAYVRWLAKERARDIARSTRRRDRHARLFSQLDSADVWAIRGTQARDPPDIERFGDDLHRAIESLDARSRRVVELLLEGENQAAIARRMGVCEGTISRIRASTIETLRAAIGVSSGARATRRSPK